ncbi:hypothetical protein ACR6HW_12420 [Fusibacter sp. JL298sf-3]
MAEQLLKVRIEADQSTMPFSEETIFKAISENIESVTTDSDEACLLVTGPMAIVLYWEEDVAVVQQVLYASDIMKDHEC